MDRLAQSDDFLRWRPAPPGVTPGVAAKPPAGAPVLVPDVEVGSLGAGGVPFGGERAALAVLLIGG